MSNPLLTHHINKVALDALLEMYADPERAQGGNWHADPTYDDPWNYQGTEPENVKYGEGVPAEASTDSDKEADTPLPEGKHDPVDPLLNPQDKIFKRSLEAVLAAAGGKSFMFQNFRFAEDAAAHLTETIKMGSARADFRTIWAWAENYFPKRAADNTEDIGTKQSGFAEGGPFSCMDCVHRTPHSKDAKGEEVDSCKHPKVCSDPELKDRLLPDGMIRVGYDDCCNFVQPHPKGSEEKTSAVIQKLTPKDLPQRDDMRKHLDDDVKKEIDELTNIPKHEGTKGVHVGAGLKWRVDPEAVGRYRSFERRGWPTAEYPNGDIAACIECADEYVPAFVREGKHAPLTVFVAAWRTDPEERKQKGAFGWRKLTKQFATLKEAQTATAQCLSEHPELHQTETPTPPKTSAKKPLPPEKKYPDSAEGAIACLTELSTYKTKGATVRPDPSVQGVWQVTMPAEQGRRAIVYLAGYRDPWGKVRPNNDFESEDEPESNNFDTVATVTDDSGVTTSLLRRPDYGESKSYTSEANAEAKTGAEKLKWRVDSPPTGRYRSFDRRGWPTADYPNGDFAASIVCADEYIPSKIKSGEHAPLEVWIADWNIPPEERGKRGRWVRRKMKGTFPTLKAAQAAAQQLIDQHPELHKLDEPAPAPEAKPEVKTSDLGDAMRLEDEVNEQSLDQSRDAKREAYQSFLQDKDLQQDAQDNGWTMEELWTQMGDDYTNEYWQGRTASVKKVAACPNCSSIKVLPVRDVAVKSASGNPLLECMKCGSFFTF